MAYQINADRLEEGNADGEVKRSKTDRCVDRRDLIFCSCTNICISCIFIHGIGWTNEVVVKVGKTLTQGCRMSSIAICNGKSRLQQASVQEVHGRVKGRVGELDPKRKDLLLSRVGSVSV